MMRKLICFVLCGILLLTSTYCFAITGEMHEKELEQIFLGTTLSDTQKAPKIHGNDAAVMFGYLEDAIYLCIDQMGNKGQKWLDELNNDFGVEGLPKSIDDISVPEQDHEKYTHLGWDYKDYQLQDKWAIRQNILLATVSKVFGFPIDEGKSGNEKYSEQCVEMSKLIYYIHILGDHEYNSLASSTDRIQLKNATKTKGEVVIGLINELRKCIAKLFWGQRTSLIYNRLMVKLNVVRFGSWIAGEEQSNDGIKRGSEEYIKNEKRHAKIQDIAKQTLKYLEPQLREMLLKMDFYKNVFGDICSVK